MVTLAEIIKRWRLERQGLSSGKKRKVNEEDSLSRKLDGSLYLRAGVFALFLVAMAGMCAQMSRYGVYLQPTHLKIWQTVFIVLGVMTVFVLNHREKLPKCSLLVLTFGGLFLQVFLACLAVYLFQSYGKPPTFALLVTPYALVPMVHSILLGRWLGIFSAVFSALLMSILLPSPMSDETLIIALGTGLSAVYSARGMSKRRQILHAGLISGVVMLISAWAMEVIPLQVSSQEVTTRQVIVQSLIVLGVGYSSGLFVGGILPALEGFFRITTKMTWMELGDLNHKLLRRLQLEAPGTYHHSMVVASLSEAAAENIGANAQLCRVASYFHDIGKIEKPDYFIENQGDTNPHDSISPNMSALVIIAHVKDGVDIAVRHKLNPAIINIIEEHHGNSLVYYFYRKALTARDSIIAEVEEGKRNEEDVPNVPEKGFRYPGPRPRTKESGIICLADSIESASRSMKKVSLSKLQSMIDDIVNNKIKDGQLDHCPLTFQELNTIKETFANSLRSMLHSRIDYPKENEDGSRKSTREPKPPTDPETNEVPPSKRKDPPTVSSPRLLASQEKQS